MLLDGPRLAALSGQRPDSRIVLIHGTEDDVVAITSMSLAETALAGAGAGVKTHVTPEVGQIGVSACDSLKICLDTAERRGLGRVVNRRFYDWRTGGFGAIGHCQANRRTTLVGQKPS